MIYKFYYLQWLDGMELDENKYFVTEEGKLFSLYIKNKITEYVELKPYTDKRYGYDTYNLKFKDGWKVIRAHRAIIAAFNQDMNESGISTEFTVDHLDCNKLNNSKCNLEYVSLEENIKRAHKNGIYLKLYERQSTMDNLDVLLIRYFFWILDLSYDEIYTIYENKTSMSNIREIILGRNRISVPFPQGELFGLENKTKFFHINKRDTEFKKIPFNNANKNNIKIQLDPSIMYWNVVYENKIIQPLKLLGRLDLISKIKMENHPLLNYIVY